MVDESIVAALKKVDLCIAEVAAWLTKTLLKLNRKNSEAIVFFPAKQQKIILFISGVEPAEEDLQDQFSATFLQSTITIYTVNVGNSKKVQSVLQYMTKVSSKPGISIHINVNKMIKKQMTPYRRHAMLPTIEQGRTASLSSPHRDLLGLGVIISVRQPVFHGEGRVVGMVGVDIRLTDLLYKSPGLHKGVNTYLFMFDRRDDSTFLHPLMPDTKAQNYVNIRILESVANDYGILNRMARGESGQKNITTSRLTSHGFLHRQGVRVVSVEAEYSWKPIDGTPLTLCLVVGKHDSKPVYQLPNTAADVPFLYAKGIKSDTQCKNFGRIVLKDKTSVVFTSDAFLDPVTFLASKVTPEQIELYNNIVRGKSSVSLLKEGVLQEVAITALLHDLWTQPQSRATVTYAVWRYVFLTSGVLRVYPALVLPEHYEVLGRLWYENAKGMPGISAISTPYLDNWGGGYMITVSHAVYAGNPNHQHSEGDIVVGVVAVDVSIEYFQFLIQELFAECKQEDFSCFAIDVSGYVVICESMLAPPVDKKPHKVANIHITDAGHQSLRRGTRLSQSGRRLHQEDSPWESWLIIPLGYRYLPVKIVRLLLAPRSPHDKQIHAREPVIAKHMLENGYMTKQSCYEFNNLDRYYTYKVYMNLTVEHMDENPCYNLWHVPKTTVFVLIKHKDKDHKEIVVPKYEHCHNLTDFSTDGPCYVGNNIHICPPTPFSYDPWLPCTMTKSPKAIDFSYMKEEKKRINSITRCFEYRCREKRHRQ
ncbi:hypothetical protein LSAT2_033040 [Lamellibrachia satsuma]|nr:hypothetical protein LSAT2_033040 [Lamellibrachia satsuma]